MRWTWLVVAETVGGMRLGSSGELGRRAQGSSPSDQRERRGVLAWVSSAAFTTVIAPDAGAVESTARYVDQMVVDASGTVVDRVRRYTGEATGLEFRKVPVYDAFFAEDWPETPPFGEADFKRLDEADDAQFYQRPRLVYHIDEGASAALTNYYKTTIPTRARVLDLCSSWVSHFPVSNSYAKAVGVGMNDFELRNNPQLDSYVVRDLNLDPTLPFPDDSFDVATIVVSIDYLTKPIDVLREVKRVLSPTNGKILVSQSNRCFYTKATRLWLGMSDLDHLNLIGQFLYYAGFKGHPRAFDITARGRGAKDPMFVVECSVV